ncbi:hypothetical protein GCK32_009658 [Trichostrongylus colubriformis]|uniref:Transmembrane protein n=1 Tax=Trichostrongylus colubriformis TaxID=6319 RepID=A0AAN8ILY0_TRICO
MAAVEYPIKYGGAGLTRFDEDEHETKEGTTKQSAGSLKRARAGSEGGGCKCAEIIMIIIAVLCVVAVVLSIWQFRFEHIGYIILYAILAIVIIVGFVTKSSFCMLIAMIIFVITVIIFSLLLAIIIYGAITTNEPILDRIVAVIVGIVGVVLPLIACCSANTLRQEYA